MKGVELPISTLIVVIVALVVLVAIIGLFYSVWPSGAETVSLEVAKQNACELLSSMGCIPTTDSININNFDADRDGVVRTDVGIATGSCGDAANPDSANDNLYMLCKCYYNADEEDCKRQVCYCP